jgi:hypothetical protein
MINFKYNSPALTNLIQVILITALTVLTLIYIYRSHELKNMEVVLDQDDDPISEVISNDFNVTNIIK